ncbi:MULTISPECIES: hypothetical protein, partial [Hyphomicrobiales]|uniref:hypothetical protein n=1 Tax=Methylobacterium sp. CCH7-A2 TaxID=1768789 RepID=UPI000A73AE68
PTRPSDVGSGAKMSEPWRHQVELKLDPAAAPERLRRIEAWCGEWQIGFQVVDHSPAATTLRLAFQEPRLARAFMGHFGGVPVPDDEVERAMVEDATVEDAYDRLAREYDVED